MMRLIRMACASVLMPGICAAQVGPRIIPEAPGSTTGFASPEMALQRLRSRHDVTFEKRSGWLAAMDHVNRTVWYFSPSGHPANPSAIKRYVVVEADGRVSIKTAIQCGGTKAACDQLALEYQ